MRPLTIFGKLSQQGTSRRLMLVHRWYVQYLLHLIPEADTPSLQVAKAPMDALHTLEQTTTSLVSSIMSEQASSSSLGGPTTLTISATLKPRITLPARNITLSELQRCKRQFVTVRKKAITLGSTEKGAVDWGEESVAGKFVDYLEENLKP